MSLYLAGAVQEDPGMSKVENNRAETEAAYYFSIKKIRKIMLQFQALLVQSTEGFLTATVHAFHKKLYFIIL